jgi:RHS repeat-associated protein
MPTDIGFTAQRLDASGLMYYGARYYSPVIGRFVSADTIVPNAANPQAWNRYTYVHNNPLVYIDPSGHDPLDEAWEQAFYEAHGRMPNDNDRRDRLFSLLFPGHGSGGAWTDADWEEYSLHKDEYWRGRREWDGEMAPGIDRFVAHLNKLAAHYNPGEEDAFVQATGYIWGGFPLIDPLMSSLVMNEHTDFIHRHVFPPLFEGTENWKSELVEGRNPAHHYIGLFYTGFFLGPEIGYATNHIRDGVFSGYSEPDLILGDHGVTVGVFLHYGVVNMSQIGLITQHIIDSRIR